MSTRSTAWSWQQPVSDASAKLLLLALAEYSNEHHIACVSYRRLKQITGIRTNTTLSKKISLLETQKMIQRIPQINSTGGTDTSAYQLLVPGCQAQPEAQPKPGKTRPGVRDQIQTYPDDLNITAWSLWLDYKKEQFKDTYKSPRSEQIACKKLIQLSDGDHNRQLAIVEQSIANTWKGLFPLQENHHGRQSGGQNQADWRAGLAEVFSADGSPQPGTAETGAEAEAGEIIIDADYLADTTPHQSLTGKALPHTPVVSQGLPDTGRFESDCPGVRPYFDPEADQ